MSFAGSPLCAFDYSHLRDDACWKVHEEKQQIEFVKRLQSIAPPGISYEMRDGILFHRSTGDEFQAAMKQIGLSDENIAKACANLRQGRPLWNFPRFRQRVLSYANWFRALYRDIAGEIAPTPVIRFSFDEFINAGAMPGKEGDVILVNYGILNVQSWCMFKQFIHRRMMTEERLISGTGYGLGKPGGFINPMTQPARTRRLLARLVSDFAGYPNFDQEYATETYLTEMAIWNTHTDELLASAGHGGRDSNWDTIEAFLLCHEFGHIVLRHTDEIRHWELEPWPHLAADERSIRRCRRREMEFEADAFAFRFAPHLQAIARQAGEAIIRQPSSDPEYVKNVVQPLCDLFTIMEIAQDHLTDSEDWMYPTGTERFENLYPGALELSAKNSPGAQDPIAGWKTTVMMPLNMKLV